MQNNSIGCNVTECVHHAKKVDECTLQHIEVIRHNTPATCPECTDCGSFARE